MGDMWPTARVVAPEEWERGQGLIGFVWRVRHTKVTKRMASGRRPWCLCSRLAQTSMRHIAWGEKHLPEEQRVGYIDKGHKEGDSCDDPLETPLNWK